MNTVQEICAALRAAEEMTIVMHRHPDGDTVGSAAALGECMAALGKRVRYACPDPISPKYRDLIDPAQMTDAPCGAIVAVDVAAPDMAGRFSDAVQNADIIIDHHGTNPCPGKYNLVRPSAAATGEIIYDIVREIGTLTKNVAYALYVAVSTDTGCFRHGNTTPYTHTVAAALMETGLDITELNRRLFVIKTPAAFAARGRIMDNIHVFADGQASITYIDLAFIEKNGVGEDDLENISSLPMEMQGVRVAATLRETQAGVYKVSLRTDGTVDGAAVAGKFDGGGHRMAAGCTLRGSLADCEEQMRLAICGALGTE